MLVIDHAIPFYRKPPETARSGPYIMISTPFSIHHYAITNQTTAYSHAHNQPRMYLIVLSPNQLLAPYFVVIQPNRTESLIRTGKKVHIDVKHRIIIEETGIVETVRSRGIYTHYKSASLSAFYGP